MRLDEARGIKAETDLNSDGRWVRVTGKFGKTRDVPIPVELMPIVEEQLRADGKLWTQSPQRLREVIVNACKDRRAQIRVNGHAGPCSQTVISRLARPPAGR